MTFIITGPGRSETRWVARVLKGFGIRCYHEAVFNPKTATVWDLGIELAYTYEDFLDRDDGVLDGEVSWMAAPYLSLVAKTSPVIHLVRDPLTTARSLMGRLFSDGRNNDYRNFALRHAPGIEAMDEVNACVHYVYVWNKMVERRADMRVRLEDLQTVAPWRALLELVGHEREAIVIQSAIDSPLDRNPRLSQQAPIITWPDVDLPWKEEVFAQAERYGYR